MTERTPVTRTVTLWPAGPVVDERGGAKHYKGAHFEIQPPIEATLSAYAIAKATQSVSRGPHTLETATLYITQSKASPTRGVALFGAYGKGREPSDHPSPIRDMEPELERAFEVVAPGDDIELVYVDEMPALAQSAVQLEIPASHPHAVE